MTLPRNQRIAIAITALLFSTLACRAATRLIIPDTPTPQPTATFTPTPIPTPTLPPIATPTIEYVASCPLVLDRIIRDSTSSNENIFSSEATSNEDVAYLIQYSVIGDEIKNPKLDRSRKISKLNRRTAPLTKRSGSISHVSFLPNSAWFSTVFRSSPMANTISWRLSISQIETRINGN